MFASIYQLVTDSVLCVTGGVGSTGEQPVVFHVDCVLTLSHGRLLSQLFASVGRDEERVEG